MIKTARLRFHREKVLTIEGDDESDATGQVQAETGFGDDGQALQPRSKNSKAAQTWLDIAADQSFF
jgi:hypothetical protein